MIEKLMQKQRKAEMRMIVKSMPLQKDGTGKPH